MKIPRPAPGWLAVLAIIAYLSLEPLLGPESTAQGPDAQPVAEAAVAVEGSELPYPGQWTSGIPLDAWAEAEILWGSRDYAPTWQEWYGRQLQFTQAPEPEAQTSQTHYWNPRGWVGLSAARAQETDGLPEAPAAGDASTLADSMYARWVIQHHIATALDQLVAEGLTVTTQPDPAQTALLTQIEAHLKAIADKPAGGGITDDQLNAIISAVHRRTPTAAQWNQLLNAVGTVGDKPTGQLTPEQLKALTDAISGIGASIEALGDELEAVLGGSVAPPAE